MKHVLLAALAVALFLVTPASLTACSGGAAGGATAGGSGSAGGSGTAGGMMATLDTSAKIMTYLEGKRLAMEGANIPSHPNGLNENAYFGATTQCYKSTVINVMAGNFNVAAELGTWRSLDGGTPMNGTVGQCDRATVSGPFSATSSAIMISNITGNAECFDIEVNYGNYSQEGRASIDQTTGQAKMELYFKNAAVDNKCANGNPGATGVKQVVAGMQYAFTGNAVQTYVISTP
ncbi:MAG: hypothetical protein JNK82_22540 [Myxococcaceae bacterium]|nr:hypothetical protein [Myxococcaceae bacterium]